MRRADTTTRALKLLMQDHRRIRKLIRVALRTRRDPLAFRQAVALACAEIEAHAQIEHRLLYPSLKAGEARNAVVAAEIEHGVISNLASSLAAGGPADERFLPTFQVLGAYVEQHIAEEEGALFTQVTRAGVDLAPLAATLLERQRRGAVTDVDVEALDSDEGFSSPPHGGHLAEARQRSRTPGRRGAH